jgi:hypothetical protein
MSHIHAPKFSKASPGMDYSRLFHAALGVIGVAFLTLTLLTPKKDLYAEKTTSFSPSDKNRGEVNVPLLSTQIDAGITSDADQPYFIPAPEL